MRGNELTWAEAVAWLRSQPDKQALVQECYYDDPLLAAAKRFAASDEWHAVRNWLPLASGRALDIGAGRGIGSYALTRCGWSVTALEPDPSPLVGAGAIRSLVQQTRVDIEVIEKSGEALPLATATFDLVYGRQVLHHARNLPCFCEEMARVLKPGGRFIATREHVIDRPADLAQFLDRHPLQRLYGGENAFLLSDYRRAITASGLRLVKILGPCESPINYAPLTSAQWRQQCVTYLARVIGHRAAQLLLDAGRPWGDRALSYLSSLISKRLHTPGRLFSFIADKPMVEGKGE